MGGAWLLLAGASGVLERSGHGLRSVARRLQGAHTHSRATCPQSWPVGLAAWGHVESPPTRG